MKEASSPVMCYGEEETPLKMNRASTRTVDYSPLYLRKAVFVESETIQR